MKKEEGGGEAEIEKKITERKRKGAEKYKNCEPIDGCGFDSASAFNLSLSRLFYVSVHSKMTLV